MDASEAGRGTLDLSVGPPGKTVPHNVKDIGKQLFLIEFVPEEPVDHEVSVQFNDVHIPGMATYATTLSMSQPGMSQPGVFQCICHKAVCYNALLLQLSLFLLPLHPLPLL